jgi:preprotein translocase SecE subunit
MKRLVIFFEEVYGELRKIQWPPFSDFIFSTIATLIIVALFSVFFFFVDGMIGYCIRAIVERFV